LIDLDFTEWYVLSICLLRSMDVAQCPSLLCSYTALIG
jgi:hypothetical protein